VQAMSSDREIDLILYWSASRSEWVASVRWFVPPVIDSGHESGWKDKMVSAPDAIHAITSLLLSLGADL
jgi:hypothetical protein